MILDKLRRKKKPKGPSLSRSDFLRLRPIRNPHVKWKKDEEGKIRIVIPLKKKAKDGKKVANKRVSFLSKLFPEPEEKRIQLDEIGSIVWELCSGERTAKEIVDHLCQKYKLLPREAEVPLSSYLNSLAKRGLVGFIVPEDLKERLEKIKEES
ncbi:TPA: PqqD family protein [Candidatus Bathyarchaeota archaeon]|nr:PqqD family protein [Candidatus Bathyarchaeota archaeon]